MIRPKKLTVKRKSGYDGNLQDYTYDIVCANVEDEPEGKSIYIQCDADLRPEEAEQLNKWLTNAIIWAKQPSRKKVLPKP